MHKLIVPTAAVALLAATSFALAADAQAMIKNIDAKKDTMTLDSGATCWAPPSVKLSHFKVGQKVDVTYTQANGKVEISTVQAGRLTASASQSGRRRPIEA